MLGGAGPDLRPGASPSLEYDCDPDKLARVFDNLLRNACHYSTPGSVVRISGGEEGDSIVLRFLNSGRTIPRRSWRASLTSSSA